MKQHELVDRIKEICFEFDDRFARVGINFARAELAKELAEAEEINITMRAVLQNIVKMFDAYFASDDVCPCKGCVARRKTIKQARKAIK